MPKSPRALVGHLWDTIPQPMLKKPPLLGRLPFIAIGVLLFQAGFACSRWTLGQLGTALSREVPISVAAKLEIQAADASSRVLEVRSEALATVPVADLDPIAVFAGVNPWNLSRGVAWTSGTARPGELGCVAIVGDKERYFHALKDVVVGDLVQLFTTTAVKLYAVDGIAIVPRSDIGILQDHGASSIALVAGYPFDLAGDAPMWFIVPGMVSSPDTLGVPVRAANRSKRFPL
jgi:LPXTG-site transpeptidase (sortase) family protein